MRLESPRRGIVAMLILLCLVTAGCKGPWVELAQVDTLEHYESLEEVTGAATGFQILGAIPVNMNTRVQRATEQAKSSPEYDEMRDQLRLINVSIRETGRYFFFVNFHKVEVRGTLVRPTDG